MNKNVIIAVIVAGFIILGVSALTNKPYNPSLLSGNPDYTGMYSNPDDFPVACIDGLVYMIFNNSLSIKFDINTMKPELCKK